MNDTRPDIEAMQLEGLRKMPVWRKLQLMDQLNQMVRAFALAGLRDQYPDESEAQIRFRLACRLYGEELATKAYGRPEDSGD